MTDVTQPLTAKAKLALSRAELLAAMGFEEVRNGFDHASAVVPLPQPEGQSRSRIGRFIGESALGQWWRSHPLSSVADLGQPLLARYATDHPGKLIAYGAGTGALIWVLKPWKLLSLATVLTLVVKNVDFVGLVSHAIRKGAPDRSADPAVPSVVLQSRPLD